MSGLVVFLLQAMLISLSGVMAPGPLTAAALAAGTRSRHAGARMALGHGVVEFPLLFLIMVGLGTLLASDAARVGIGVAGGGFLIYMGVQMIRNLRAADPAVQYGQQGPLRTGIVLSASNPYFLFWWATVGLALASRALELGVLALVLFAAAHWLCDFVWLEALSLASFKGSKILGGRNQRIILTVCALALLFFGVMFIHDAARRLLTGTAEEVGSPAAYVLGAGANA